MILAPVAAEKNISIAVEGEVDLTDQELKAYLEETNAKLIKLAQPENKLTNQEWRELQRLRQEINLLEKIQKARLRGNITQEASATSEYYFLKDSKKRNPIINYLMQIKLRSHIWG